MIRLYSALWSLILSGLWLATNSRPTAGWVVSLIVLDLYAWRLEAK